MEQNNQDNKNLKQILDEDGHHLSPILPDEVKNFLIDIDGTICDDIPNEEPERMKDLSTLSRCPRCH